MKADLEYYFFSVQLPWTCHWLLLWCWCWSASRKLKRPWALWRWRSLH